MSYAMEGYHSDVAAQAPASARAAFIRRTYLHLAGAILAFVGLEAVLVGSGVGTEFLKTMAVNKGAWLVLMVAFVGGGYLAQYLAQSARSVGAQYMGLAMYVLLEVVIFLPILTIATLHPQYAGKDLPLQAGIMTLMVCGGLTAAVFWSGKDFSFMGPALMVMSWLALGLVFAAVIFGFSLGLVFTFAMLALAAGYIIYDTSNVMHHYRTDQHVAAALALFASVALMFYYVLRLLMSMNSNR